MGWAVCSAEPIGACARQRSFDCMADDNVAALSHYSTTTELALPRMMAAQVMAIGERGYISPNWADWTVLP